MVSAVDITSSKAHKPTNNAPKRDINSQGSRWVSLFIINFNSFNHRTHIHHYVYWF